MTVVELYELPGKVIIPTMARTEDGIYLEVEPVTVVVDPDAQGLTAALRQSRARGNPRVPNPGPNGYPPHYVLSYAGLKSNAALQKKARLWGVRLHDGGVTVFPYTPYKPGRGYLANREADVEFSGSDSDHEAADWLIQQFGTPRV
jgi:hypothetical protein